MFRLIYGYICIRYCIIKSKVFGLHLNTARDKHIFTFVNLMDSYVVFPFVTWCEVCELQVEIKWPKEISLGI